MIAAALDHGAAVILFIILQVGAYMAVAYQPMRLPHDQLLEVIKLTPLVSIDLVLRDQESRILMGKRNNEPAKGFWFVPGGRIYKDEKLKDALCRICQTELGPNISPDSFSFREVYEHLYDTNFAEESDVSTHYIVLAYEAVTHMPDLVRSDDQHSEMKWFSETEAIKDAAVHANSRAYF